MMRRRLVLGLAVVATLGVACMLSAQDRDDSAGMFASKTLPKTDGEMRILKVIEDLAGVRREFQNVPPEDGRLLRLLVEAANAQNVVEIGTSNGYSGLWFCIALHATGGKLTTFDIDPGRISIARANFSLAGVEHMVTIIEGDAHEEVIKLTEPIDVLFLDADKPGYLDYLKKLLPLVRPGGLVLAHNMTPRMADPRFVEAITVNPTLETLFLHMDGAGMAVSLKKR